MSQLRTIKKEFCQSESVAKLSRDAQHHFIRLWTFADDEGRGLDNPKLIKAACWPLEDDVSLDEIEAWQAELASAGRIVRYGDHEKRYFEVTNWAEHQKPKYKADTKYPSPADLPNSAPTGPEPGTNPGQSGPEPAGTRTTGLGLGIDLGNDLGLGAQLETTGDKSHSARKPLSVAQEIVKDFYDESNPKPAQPYPAMLGVVEKMLKSGWPEADVRWAIRDAPAISTASLTFSLKQREGNQRGRDPAGDEIQAYMARAGQR